MPLKIRALLAPMAALLAASSAQAQSLVDPFVRIQQGDYVWSQRFPEQEIVLLGYGVALRRAFEGRCPDAISADAAARIDLFFAAWRGAEVIEILEGRKSLDLATVIVQSQADRPFITVAKRRLDALAEAEGCRGPRVRAVAANLGRMLSGRRPAFGALAGRKTLVVEKTAPIQQKHAYRERRGEKLTTRGAFQLDQDFSQVRAVGLAILECHYDKDPSDEWREVQYYWSANAPSAAGYLIPTLGHAFQHTSQRRLTKANGRRYTHPFATYGSPRWECPALADASLGVKRIYAPRKPVSDAAGQVPAPGAPKIVEKRIFVQHNYGRTPEDFVPPIPRELPAKKSLLITMEKQGAGALKSIEVQRFGWWSLAKTDLDYRNGSAEQTTFREDVGEIMKQAPRVLICKYLAKRRGIVNVSRHWFAEAPAAAEPSRLRSRMKEHPVLVIRGVRTECAARYADARR
ncbi:MAG: hypothetical protein AAFR16_00855 [Pseudomonadota bacterium]